MRLKVLCCEVLSREVYLLAANSPHACDVELLPKGLHDLGVDKMLPRLQECIDRVPPDRCDAIAMVYGLCNNGIVGLTSRRTRLVIPRAHDCITLFMGSREAYLKYFNSHPGTYYLTTGWTERNDASSAGDVTVSQKLGLYFQYEELVRKHGEDNAKYIMETLGDTMALYGRLAFISMGLPCEAPFREQAIAQARQKGWTFDDVQGSLGLLRKLIHGEWDGDFLVLEPGESVRPSHDDGVIKCGACQG
jgi:hypothetical protein